MNVRLTATVILAAGIIALIPGCTIDTNVPPPQQAPVGSGGLVISEVFMLPPTQHGTYTWFELFNASSKNIDWYSEEEIDSTTIVTEHLLLRFKARLRIYLPPNLTFIIFDTTMTVYFSNYYQGRFVAQGFIFEDPGYFNSVDNTLFPGEYTIVVNSRDSFDEHIRPGGPTDPVILEPSFDGPQNTVFPYILVPGYYFFGDQDSNFFAAIPAFWDITDANEVSLIKVVDTLRAGVHDYRTVLLDMVRFGNYRPTPDAYPDNQPLGIVPENYSISRYARYFRTGNSVDAFYLAPDPVPGYGSLRAKK